MCGFGGGGAIWGLGFEKVRLGTCVGVNTIRQGKGISDEAYRRWSTYMRQDMAVELCRTRISLCCA